VCDCALSPAGSTTRTQRRPQGGAAQRTGGGGWQDAVAGTGTVRPGPRPQAQAHTRGCCSAALGAGAGLRVFVYTAAPRQLVPVLYRPEQLRPGESRPSTPPPCAAAQAEAGGLDPRRSPSTPRARVMRRTHPRAQPRVVWWLGGTTVLVEWKRNGRTWRRFGG
jgi:hypothetical protein